MPEPLIDRHKDLYRRLRGERFAFALIPDPIMPEERRAKYAVPLAAALESAGYGTVTGGGTQLEDKRIIWVGLDLELTALPKSLDFARQTLVSLGAPRRSAIQVSVGTRSIHIPLHPEDAVEEVIRQ